MPAAAARIHPTVVIDPSAQIDSSVEIGPYAVIGEKVEIGAGCKIGAHAFMERCRIGKNCVLSPFASIGTPPQDLKYKNEPTSLVLGDECTVREFVTLNRGTLADGGEGVTRIGNKCYFMTNSHVAHDCIVGDGVILINSVALAGHVTVGDGAIFGGLSAAHQFVRVGQGVMIGGATGVERDVPPYALVEGNRARIIGVNVVGLKRSGASKSDLMSIRKAFEELFASSRPMAEAVAAIELQNPQGILREILDFLKAPSKRGITNYNSTES